MTAEHAQLFRRLHDTERPLALANAWDAMSAAIARDCGAKAVATTSAGIAWSLGFADGDRLDAQLAIDALKLIVDAARVPVTADIEGGYADTAAGVRDVVARVIQTGAVGINLEDGARSVDETADRIRAAKTAADSAGADLFVNARTDVVLAGLVAPELAIAEILARAERYLDAGADGIFVPGVTDAEQLRELATAISAPLNAMAGPGSPTVAELGALGVARVSLGSGVAQAAYQIVQDANRELLATGTYRALAQTMDYSTLNQLVS